MLLGKVAVIVQSVSLFVGMVVLLTCCRPAQGAVDFTDKTIYIRADGSIDPPNAPIISSDNVTYTLVDDIAAGTGSRLDPGALMMAIERNNVVFDGNGRGLQSLYHWGAFDGGLHIHDIENVTIKNLTISNLGHYGPENGMRLINASGVTILDCTISTYSTASLALVSSNYNTINRCSLGTTLLALENSSNNLITGCSGIISMTSSSNNIISHNKISLGIYDCANNTVSENDRIESISVSASSNNTFRDNVSVDGTYVHTSANNLFLNNTFASGTCHFYNSSDNTICGNYINGSLIIETSACNRLYHNNFSYTSSVIISGVSFNNTWDNGYPSGGNIWASYNGTDEYRGPFQNETGSDGIGDASRFVDANNVDHYPIWVESDKDGLPDGWEVNHNLNPFNASDAWADSDLDGLSNLDEYWHKTSLVNKDTDSDGLSDGLEVHVYATDPTNNDTDGDGTVDLLEAAGSGFNAGAVVLPGNWSEIDLLWSTYTINILSNSSITGVHLDSVNRQLVINITGKETASGMFNMTAPKSMIISSSDIKLLLDNQPITISLQADATNYYISATYSHSTYLLIVSFKPSEQIVDYVPYLVGGTLVALFCILIIAVLRKKR